jgi:hypothetical protein
MNSRGVQQLACLPLPHTPKENAEMYRVAKSAKRPHNFALRQLAMNRNAPRCLKRKSDAACDGDDSGDEVTLIPAIQLLIAATLTTDSAPGPLNLLAYISFEVVHQCLLKLAYEPMRRTRARLLAPDSLQDRFRRPIVGLESEVRFSVPALGAPFKDTARDPGRI